MIYIPLSQTVNHKYTLGFALRNMASYSVSDIWGYYYKQTRIYNP